MLLELFFMVATHCHLHHDSLLFRNDLPVLGPHALQQAFALDDLLSDQLSVHPSKGSVLLHYSHDVSERSITKVHRMLQDLKDLNGKWSTSWAEHLAWMISSESLS